MKISLLARCAGLGAAAVVGLAACGSGGGSNSQSGSASSGSSSSGGGGGNLTEDGSSLLYPYLQDIVQPLQQATGIHLAPAAGGSGKGISDAASGAVDMGGSDAYLPPGQLGTMKNIPIVVSAQAVNYNLPGVKNLKLTGDILAKIYQGTITNWSDPAITSINPGVKLPSMKIVPVRRVDSSGDTFLFTSLLSATNSQWKSGPGEGTTVNWPSVSGEVTADGNPGMVQSCQSTKGCVAYIGVSAEKDAQQAGLGEAMLQNKSGKFLQPTKATITAAAAAGATNMPANLAQSLIYESGANAYPIVNFEYIIVKNSPTKAASIKKFLTWVMSSSGGSQEQYLSGNDFVPLPSSVASKAMAAANQL